MKLSFRDWLLAVLAGSSFVLSAPPFDLAAPAFVTTALLWWAITGPHVRPVRNAFRIGWLAGFAASLGGFYWVIGLLDRFAHIPIPVCLLIWILLCAYGAVAWGAACAVARAVDPRSLWSLIALPAALVATDKLVPQIFPWPLAISQHRFVHLIQVADLGGPYAVTFLVALIGVSVTVAARGDRRAALVAGLVFALALGYGAVRIGEVESRRTQAPSRTVALVQPNVSIDDKHDPRMARTNVEQIQRLSADAERRGADLVIWPESSWPYRLLRTATGRDAGVRRIRQGFSADLVFGAVSMEPSGLPHWNSSYWLTRDGRLVGPADKRVLLAFGEYIPLYDQLPFLKTWFPRSGGFTRGDRPQILDDGETRLGVMNCYEDVLPEMSLELADAEPHLLLNVTNDAWFGDTSEPHLHAGLAVFRAVELRRDLARAVNTGISSVVAATGHVVAATGTFEERVLVEKVALLEGKTVYATVGDAFAWACVAAIAALLVARLARRSGSVPAPEPPAAPE